MVGLFRRFKNSRSEEKLIYALLSGLLVFLIAAYVMSAFRARVNADAGYYLGVVELIRQGYVPYRDFGLSYTPLFFYVLQFPRLLMGTFPDYTGYMLFLYLISTIDAFLLAVIVKRVTCSVKFAWLSALVFSLLYLYLDGAYFILETFSLFCGLLSMTLLTGKTPSFWRCLLSGACCALAFWSKQYGVLFAGFIGVLLLLSGGGWKNRLINCLYAFGGFAFVIFLFASLFLASGVGLKNLVTSLSGSAYGGQSLGLYAEGVVKTCRLFPYLLFLPCLLFFRKDFEIPLAWACCASLVLASFQFYFNVFPHYYIYMLPFVLVLNAMIWRKMKSCTGRGVLFLLYFGVFFTACALPMQDVYKDVKSLTKHDLRDVQNNAANQIRQVVQEYGIESALCINGTVPYYALCPLVPSAIVEYGFAFGYDTEDSFLKRLKDADCFVIHQRDIEEIQSMRELSAELSSDFYMLETHFSDGVRVYINREKGMK